LALLPDLPPVADALPGFNGVFWQGLFGPAGLPAPIVARAAQALAVATRDPDLIARMGEQGVVLETGGPEVLARTLAEELVMWGDLIRSQNIKSE
jgi:tripartite-type tricarboxylate transporter receptor subunit TctC